MINQRKEHPFDDYPTHLGRGLSSADSAHPRGAGAVALTAVDLAVAPGPGYGLAHVESATFHRDVVRRAHFRVALLPLYGLADAAVGGVVADFQWSNNSEWQGKATFF